jgi:hypothetical protein
MPIDRLPGSFRDPSGFLFTRDGVLYRQINSPYEKEYLHLVQSGLYENLTTARWMVPHEEVEPPFALPGGAFKIIKPEPIPFISYPYEWCFSQLKDAALLTLRIQARALEYGMTLKDASAYNIQFRGANPVLIDTLSFERLRQGEPWTAYRQFCQHFLAPLALMACTDVRLGQLSRIHMDGIPLDLAAALLPRSSRFRLTLLTHIHMHARSQKRYADKAPARPSRKMTLVALKALADNLASAVKKLGWRPAETEWGDYYEDIHYSDEAFRHKQEIVKEWLQELKPARVWDLGANAGVFSRIAGDLGAFTAAFDLDPAAVEKNYLDCKKRVENRVLPLLMDLTNPSADIGWANRERVSFLGRGPSDAVLALALVHHLAISNNLPFGHIAGFFAQAGRSLIVEFVPKQDAQVRRLLSTRRDIFTEYDQAHFEKAFSERFRIVRSTAVRNSERRMYLMRKD